MNIRTKKWKKLFGVHCIFGTTRSNLKWYKVPLKHRYRVTLLIIIYNILYYKLYIINVKKLSYLEIRYNLLNKNK